MAFKADCCLYSTHLLSIYLSCLHCNLAKRLVSLINNSSVIAIQKKKISLKEIQVYNCILAFSFGHSIFISQKIFALIWVPGCVFQLTFRQRWQPVFQSSTHHLQVLASRLFPNVISYFKPQATMETHTQKMNGIHKFQVDAIKRSKMRIFTDNPILFKVWLSSTVMLALLICNWLVIISSLHRTPSPFFPK